MIENYFSGKKCLVSGGTGLIGRAVVRQLMEAGAAVISVSLDTLELEPRVVYIQADLRDVALVSSLVRNMDCVFHIAGIKGSVQVTKTRPASFFVPLLQMNTTVLEACRVAGIEDVLYTSSIGAYASAEIFREEQGLDGIPMDAFPGWAKRMGELQIAAYRQQYELDYAIVRPCAVYGPGDQFNPVTSMVIPALMARIRAGESPLKVWGDGSAIRDFLYSEDAARGMLLAMIHKTSGFVNLGSGEGISISSLVETLQDIIGFDYEFDTSKPSGYPKRVMDITKASRRLRWEPRIPLWEGLRKTWEWFMKHPDEYKHKKEFLCPSEDC